MLRMSLVYVANNPYAHIDPNTRFILSMRDFSTTSHIIFSHILCLDMKGLSVVSHLNLQIEVFECDFYRVSRLEKEIIFIFSDLTRYLIDFCDVYRIRCLTCNFF